MGFFDGIKTQQELMAKRNELIASIKTEYVTAMERIKADAKKAKVIPVIHQSDIIREDSIVSTVVMRSGTDPSSNVLTINMDLGTANY